MAIAELRGKSSAEIAAQMERIFPIESSKEDVRITDGHSFWVGVRDAKLSLVRSAEPENICSFVASIHIQSEEALAGFVGGVEFRIIDGDNNTVYAILTPGYGVNGTAIPGAESDRLVTYEEKVPLEVMVLAARIECHPRRLEGPAIDSLARTVSEIRRGIDTVKDDLAAIGISVLEVASALRL